MGGVAGVRGAAGWLGLAAAGRRHPLLGDPGPAARFALRDRRVALTAALLAGGLRGRYIPDFVTPKPPPISDADDAKVFAAQLDLIRHTPAESVDQQLRWLDPATARLIGTPPADLAGVVAAGLATFWRHVLADLWPRFRAQYRQAQHEQLAALATAGISAVLANLHDTMRWQPGWLEIDKPYVEDLRLDETELVLVPSLVVWPRLAVQVCDPRDASVIFPVGPSASRAAPHGYALLGRGRTRVLQATGTGRSTTELSHDLQLAASTVSHHLSVLLDAGLVTRTRQGHHVRYQRTDTGQRLLTTTGAR